MLYVNIFFKTFAQLAATALVTAQGYSWAVEDAVVSAETAGLGVLLAAIGALIAAGYAYVRSPATTALQKALRSGLQFLLGGASALVINTWADIVSVPSVLVPTVIGAVLAFLITYLQNQPAPPPSPTA